jgi:hypothetical protein
MYSVCNEAAVDEKLDGNRKDPNTSYTRAFFTKALQPQHSDTNITVFHHGGHLGRRPLLPAA